ncbi:PAS domain-containing protein [Aliirhizobium smilacinae]|nr:PAS domain-containing protein [Rhizobium smilacinae]
MRDSDSYAEPDCEAGIYTWCLEDDILYGDTALAALFGLDPAATLRGLSVTDYIARVHPDDQGKVAQLIREAVEDGRPYRAKYRVVNASGLIRPVMAFGRCFRDRTGIPVHYAGIVHSLDHLLS